MSEVKDLTGVCKYCGQTKIVKALTEPEADDVVTLECSCPGGEMERRKKQVTEQLDELIGELSPDNGWEPARPEAFKAIKGIAEQIAEGTIASCGIRVDDTNLKISRNKGKINIERSKTIRQGGTVEK